jgi:hypothetical protein
MEESKSEDLWTRCVFEGPPPEGYDVWYANKESNEKGVRGWVDSPIKTGVTIRATSEGSK